MPNEEHDGKSALFIATRFTGIVFDPTPPFDKITTKRPIHPAIPFDSRDDANFDNW